MERLSARDEELLTALYAEHAPALQAFARRLLGGDDQQAEDVVQETLLRAWRHADELTAEGARPWLFTVVRNLVVDRHRARRVRPPAVPTEGIEAVPAPDELDAAMLSWQIGDALHSLSTPHRQVLLEVFYRGRSVAEAAGALGIPAGTVRSRCFYALRAFRVALEERGVTGT